MTQQQQQQHQQPLALRYLNFETAEYTKKSSCHKILQPT